MMGERLRDKLTRLFSFSCSLTTASMGSGGQHAGVLLGNLLGET
jgi:hypothetical protein